MRKFILGLLTLGMGYLQAQVDELGYETAEVSMSANYANRVFFNFDDGQLNSHVADNWDVAFWRISSTDFGTRVNDAKNIEVYEASAEPSDWDNIQIGNIGSWGEVLYNPDQTESLQEGAFEQGSATYGWGEYNFITHHIEGKVIFVLKYLQDDSYVKFMITDYFGGYTFKYAKWNGTSWGETQTQTIANGTNNHYFNYFSFATNEIVANNEPEIGSWDLMFTRYWTFYNNIMMYRMAGVIQSPDLEVARVEETQATNEFTIPTTGFSKNITSIGHSWKPTSGVYDNVVYYVKKGEDIYRLYFIENGGASTGNMYFKYKKVAGNMGVTDLSRTEVKVYPNPVVHQLNIESKELVQLIQIVNSNGQILLQTRPQSNKTMVNVSGLIKGVYYLKIHTEKGVQTSTVLKK